MSIIKDTFFGGAEKKAGKAQEEASERAVEEQRRQFDVTQQQLAPFVETGVDALDQQRILLGLGARQPATTQAPAAAQPQQFGQFPSQFGGFGGAGGFPGLPGGFQFPQAGVNAPQPQAAAEPQLSAAEQQQQAFSAFGESPGQRFIRDRAQRNLLRSASAIGGLGGGNVRSALVEQGAGFAAQDFQNQLNRLASLSGGGQVTATNLGQLGAQTAGQIGAGLQQAGAARASGILGRSEGIRSGVGQVAQIAGFSDMRLKENVKKIAELDSGLSWYSWDWTPEALELVGDQIPEGVIAQEAQKVFPNAIGKRAGFLTVNYAEIH